MFALVAKRFMRSMTLMAAVVRRVTSIAAIPKSKQSRFGVLDVLDVQHGNQRNFAGEQISHKRLCASYDSGL
jgi:hypothetical protein